MKKLRNMFNTNPVPTSILTTKVVSRTAHGYMLIVGKENCKNPDARAKYYSNKLVELRVTPEGVQVAEMPSWLAIESGGMDRSRNMELNSYSNWKDGYERSRKVTNIRKHAPSFAELQSKRRMAT